MNKNKLVQLIEQTASPELLMVLKQHLTSAEFAELSHHLAQDYDIEFMKLTDGKLQPMWTDDEVDIVDDVDPSEFKSILLDYLR